MHSNDETLRPAARSRTVARRALVLGLALCFIAPAASAADRTRGASERLAKLVERLELDADQKRKVQALHAQLRRTSKPLKRQLRVLRTDVRGLWATSAPDRAAILKKTAEITRVREQIEIARIDYRLKVHEVLTPAQRTVFHRRGKRTARGQR